MDQSPKIEFRGISKRDIEISNKIVDLLGMEYKDDALQALVTLQYTLDIAKEMSGIGIGTFEIQKSGISSKEG